MWSGGLGSVCASNVEVEVDVGCCLVSVTLDSPKLRLRSRIPVKLMSACLSHLCLTSRLLIMNLGTPESTCIVPKCHAVSSIDTLSLPQLRRPSLRDTQVSFNSPSPVHYPRETMAVPRSEYLSNVWRDGIFGLKSLYVNSTKLTSAIQITRSSFVLEEQGQSAVLKCEQWSISERMRASSDEMSRRQRTWPRA